MSTIYDVLRYVVRNQGHSSGDVERDLLLTIDSAEQGFADLESYKEQLAAQEREAKAANSTAAQKVDAAQAQAAAINTASEADLEAELERRAAIRRAQGGTQTLRGSAPAFAGGEQKGDPFVPGSRPAI